MIEAAHRGPCHNAPSLHRLDKTLLQQARRRAVEAIVDRLGMKGYSLQLPGRIADRALAVVALGLAVLRTQVSRVSCRELQQIFKRRNPIRMESVQLGEAGERGDRGVLFGEAAWIGIAVGAMAARSASVNRLTNGGADKICGGINLQGGSWSNGS